MPKRSLVEALPETIRQELNKRLISNGFSGYEALSDWLKREGYEISKSSVHRYGEAFEERLAALRLATEQARAVAETVGDDENLLGDALARVVQEKAFSVLINANLTSDKDDIEKLSNLGRMVATLNRASITQKKYMDEVRARTEAAADDVEENLKKSGASEETIAYARAKMMGIVP